MYVNIPSKGPASSPAHKLPPGLIRVSVFSHMHSVASQTTFPGPHRTLNAAEEGLRSSAGSRTMPGINLIAQCPDAQVFKYHP